MDNTEMGTQKFQDFQEGQWQFMQDSNPADSKSWGIPEFGKILNGFAGIPIKIHKILGKYIGFQSGSLSIYYRTSNVVHGGCTLLRRGLE